MPGIKTGSFYGCYNHTPLGSVDWASYFFNSIQITYLGIRFLEFGLCGISDRIKFDGM